ncbi:MAG: hypothetical protein AAGD38_11025 [Acidobacteriota bacterium]
MSVDLFKLDKLKITAFTDAKRQPKQGGLLSGLLPQAGQFEAMFNPKSFRQSYAIDWGRKGALNSSGEDLLYRQSPPLVFSLELLLDGTGVADGPESLALPSRSVENRLKEFLEIVYTYNGELHEPNHLLVEWGSESHSCRLAKLDVRYTFIGRNGKPLRAELDVTFVGDEELERRLKRENKKSPDLTRRHLVTAGETLPLLSREFYGSADHYLDLARVNDLDDFRFLEPGTTLVVPPLASLTGES